MTLEDQKQLDDILLDETNVKELVRSVIADGEKKWLVYNRETRKYRVEPLIYASFP